LVLFALVTTVVWFVAEALYHLLTGGPDLRHNPSFTAASAAALLLVTLISFVPFPTGYLLSLGVWWLAARHILELPMPRALLLWLLLAALSMASRLALLGALHF
jgi:hypothetical protein